MPDYVTPLPGTPLANSMVGLANGPVGAPNETVQPLAQSQQMQMTVPGILAYGILGMGVGAFDTIGQSFGILGENDMQNMLSTIAPGGFGDFYKQNEQGLRIGGEILSLPIPGKVGLWGLRTAQWARQNGKLGTFLKNSTSAEAIFGSAARLNSTEQNLIAKAVEIKENAGTFAGRSFDNPVIRAAKKSFNAERVIKTAREAAAFEVAYRAFYNKSELLAPSEYNLQDELGWAGAGIALGGGIGFVQARYAARQLIKAAPELSPTAAASLRELRTFAGSDIGNVVSLPEHRGPLTTFFARLKELTNAAIVDAASPALKTNLQTDMDAIDKILKSSLTDMGRDVHPFLNSFQMADEQAALGITALSKNPLLMLFSPKIGEITQGSQEFYNGITSELDRLKKFGLRLESRIARTLTKSRKQSTADKKLRIRTEAQARQAELKEEYDAVEKFSNQHHFVIESWGDVVPYRLRPDNYLDQNDFKSITRTRWRQSESDITSPGKVIGVDHSKLQIGTMTLDDRFILEGGTDLSPTGWSQVYAMGSKMIGEWKAVPNQVFPVTDEMPRFQLEAIMALGEQNKQAASLIKLGGKFQSMKDVEFHILGEKYKEWLAAIPRTERKTRGARDALASRTAISPEELIDSLNLPRSNGIQPNPLVDLFVQLRAQGTKSLDAVFKKSTSLDPNAQHPLDLLQAQLRNTANITDQSVNLPISGNMLKQKNVRPLLVVSDAVPLMGVADALISARVQEIQALTLQRLGQIKTPIVAGVLQHVASAAAIQQAKDVTSLHDTVASGRGIVVPQDRINEQYDAIKAVSLLAQDSDNFVLANVRKLFDAKLSGLYAQIRHKNNYNSLVDASRVEQAYRHGWDVEAVEYLADGKSAQFVLKADSEQNKKLMQRWFQTDLPAGQKNYMPDMSISARKAGAVPLRVTKLSADFMDEVSRLSIGAGAEDNALRAARGKGAIQLRAWHLPAPELSMENAWFVRDEAGDVVDLYYLGTEAQNKARALAASEKLGAANKGRYIANSYESTRLQHQWSDDPLHFINYSDQHLKTGAAIEGGSARAEIDRTSNTIDKMVNTLAQQYVNVGTRARAAIFEPQIRFAREASLYAGKPSGLASGENNIFDRYLAQLYSRTTQSGSGFVSRGYKLFENAYDATLTYLYGVKSELSAGSAEGVAAARGLKKLVKDNVSDAEFHQYKKLENWSPFETTLDWMESTHREMDTSFARKHAVLLSKASATMSLRFLDVGTMLLNYSSLMTNTLPIIRAMRPRAGQSFDQWISENAAWGSRLSSKDVITFSPMRAMVSTIGNYWNGKHLKRLERAAAEGIFDPEWLRLEQAMVVAPKRKGNEWVEKAAEWSTKAADHSEIMSRRIAFGLGLDLGESLFKLTDDRNLNIFATHFMNQMIGNYNPRNKPGMYQGALGLPLGAFMTYMFNYYKRMFGYLEKGEWSTLAAQFATQASFFGAQSVPGWALFNHYLFSDYDGSDNLATRLDRKLTPGVAELVLHGSLTGIPKIFGVDAPAFYPRGSVDMTQMPATPADWQRAPPVIFLKSLWDGAAATMGNAMAGANLQQQEEILANYSTNRAIKFVMETAAGARVDRAGQMVDSSVRDFASIAAGLVGTVPASARRVQDAYNAQQLVEVNQANARSKLNDHMRAMMRSGNFGTIDVQDIMLRYIKSGGNPAYFGTWLRNNVEASFFPKGERKLLELSRGADWIEMQNMMAAIQFEPGAQP